MGSAAKNRLSASACDVLVIGDEVESIITAVSAARAGVKVILARKSIGRLGGLSVRGGLSYMDITPEFVTGLFQEFLQRTQVVRVALNPQAADTELATILAEAGVTVISGVSAQVETDASGKPVHVRLQNHETETLDLYPHIIIDATPDADIARALGVPYLVGLGGILGAEQNFLGISPVFTITGVPVPAFQAFEASLRQKPGVQDMLDHALPYHSSELRAEYVTRPTYAPDDMDYLDILNPLIGIDYHTWRHGTPGSYAHAGIFIDGGNVSRLEDGSLGFNGLVAKMDALHLDFDGLLALSRGGPIPKILLDEMACFERYLRQAGGFEKACVIPPEELYVRQTVTLLSRENMTARKAIEGGVPAEKAIGTFSYWLDLRGAMLWRLFPGEHLPKPVFNVGLDVALPLAPCLSHFAFVSRSAGYSPIGQGTGRIVQHNALLGEGLGIAAALAVLSQCSLIEIADTAMPQIQAILAARRQGALDLTGYPIWMPSQIDASELLKQDTAAIQRLRAQSTDFSLL